ncbi:MAG: hypothetical protein RIG77_09705 [Cyclobacteriaceae bacterium]
MIDNIKSSIPLYSAAFIFLGYLNYHFYFSEFDIEIHKYLSTTELIFSFLPLTIPFLLVVVFFAVFSLGSAIIILRPEKIGGDGTNHDINDDLFQHLTSTPVAWNHLISLKPRWTSPSFWLSAVFSTTLLLTSITVNILLVAYVYSFIDGFISETPKFSAGTNTLFGIVWVIVVFMKIESQKNQSYKSSYNFFFNIIIITLFIGLLRMNKKENAETILEGKPEYSAKLTLADTTITTTDSTLLFVGQTSNFIFLRHIPAEKNIIIKAADIKFLELTKK